MSKITNLTSVNIQRFKKLQESFGNEKTCLYVNYCLNCWQISKYTLDDGQIWFHRSLEKQAEESGLSRRTIERNLKKLCEEGYLERVSKLFGKKRLQIRVTHKLLAVIGEVDINHGKKAEEGEVKTPKSITFKQDGATNHAKMAQTYNEDKDLNNKKTNTISNFDTVSCGKSKNYKPIKYKIEHEIGERVTEEIKNAVKARIVNLKKQNGLLVTDEEKLFAEMLFYAIEPNQSTFTTDPIKRLNIAAKLLRQGQWSQPKGFTRYWDIGKLFKEREETCERISFEEKLKRELLGIECKEARAQIKARLERSYEEERKYCKNGTSRPKSTQKQLDDSTLYGQALSHVRSPEGESVVPLSIDSQLAHLEQEIAKKEEVFFNSKNELKHAHPLLIKHLKRAHDTLAKEIANMYEQKANFECEAAA